MNTRSMLPDGLYIIIKFIDNTWWNQANYVSKTIHSCAWDYTVLLIVLKKNTEPHKLDVIFCFFI